MTCCDMAHKAKALTPGESISWPESGVLPELNR